jgi:heme A synthase
VEEFKYIYYWEYGHRMVGRALSLVFGLPALYFAGRGMINAALGRRLALVFLMGGTQGLVGWWMVRSGLQVGPSSSRLLCLPLSLPLSLPFSLPFSHIVSEGREG